MNPLRPLGLAAGLLALSIAVAGPGCGSTEDLMLPSTGNGATSTSRSSGSTSSSDGGGDGAGGDGAGGAGTGGSGTGGAASVADPNKDGPYTYAEADATAQVASTGDNVAIHYAYPTDGPTSGPYPIVVVAHGFQLKSSLYHGYIKRLASFGYVALTADYYAGFQTDHVRSAKTLIGAVDWAKAQSETSGSALFGKVDAELTGMTGHSLGGKLALHASKLDPRVKAAITLDPVDSATFCDATKCPDVSEMMPLDVPIGFLGETLDSAPGPFGQACAPAGDNYATFYAKTTKPSLEVTVLGASHMSFLDNPECGLACNACNAATTDDAAVNALARAYVVAFYERYLRGDAAYDAYLTGAEAEARYVDTGLATIQSK